MKNWKRTFFRIDGKKGTAIFGRAAAVDRDLAVLADRREVDLQVGGQVKFDDAVDARSDGQVHAALGDVFASCS